MKSDVIRTYTPDVREVFSSREEANPGVPVQTLSPAAEWRYSAKTCIKETAGE